MFKLLKGKKTVILLLTLIMLLSLLANSTMADEEDEPTPTLLFQDENGNLKAWWMDGKDRVESDIFATLEDGWELKAVEDADGDGHPDLYLQHQEDGLVEIWHMEGLIVTTTTVVINPSPDRDTMLPVWEMKGVGDLNDSGEPDIIWQHEGDGEMGELAVWVMEDLAAIKTGRLYNKEIGEDSEVRVMWQIGAITNLLDNDSDAPEILWQAVEGKFLDELAYWNVDVTGEHFYRKSSGRITQADGRTSISPNWRMRAAIDLFGDDSPEILFQGIDDVLEGLLAYWQMDGAERIAGARLNPDNIDPQWTLKAAAMIKAPEQKLQVISVEAITTTGVDVTIEELEADLDDANVEVINPADEVVATVPTDLLEGATSATFDFEEELNEVMPGIWTVNGVEYTVLITVEVSDAVELYDALDNQEDYDRIILTADITGVDYNVTLSKDSLVFDLDGHDLTLDADYNFSVTGDDIQVLGSDLTLSGAGAVTISGDNVSVEGVDFELANGNFTISGENVTVEGGSVTGTGDAEVAITGDFAKLDGVEVTLDNQPFTIDHTEGVTVQGGSITLGSGNIVIASTDTTNYSADTTLTGIEIATTGDLDVQEYSEGTVLEDLTFDGAIFGQILISADTTLNGATLKNAADDIDIVLANEARLTASGTVELEDASNDLTIEGAGIVDGDLLVEGLGDVILADDDLVVNGATFDVAAVTINNNPSLGEVTFQADVTVDHGTMTIVNNKVVTLDEANLIAGVNAAFNINTANLDPGVLTVLPVRGTIRGVTGDEEIRPNTNSGGNNLNLGARLKLENLVVKNDSNDTPLTLTGNVTMADVKVLDAAPARFIFTGAHTLTLEGDLELEANELDVTSGDAAIVGNGNKIHGDGSIRFSGDGVEVGGVVFDVAVDVAHKVNLTGDITLEEDIELTLSVAASEIDGDDNSVLGEGKIVSNDNNAEIKDTFLEVDLDVVDNNLKFTNGGWAAANTVTVDDQTITFVGAEGGVENLGLIKLTHDNAQVEGDAGENANYFLLNDAGITAVDFADKQVNETDLPYNLFFTLSNMEFGENVTMVAGIAGVRLKDDFTEFKVYQAGTEVPATVAEVTARTIGNLDNQPDEDLTITAGADGMAPGVYEIRHRDAEGDNEGIAQTENVKAERAIEIDIASTSDSYDFTYNLVSGNATQISVDDANVAHNPTQDQTIDNIEVQDENGLAVEGVQVEFVVTGKQEVMDRVLSDLEQTLTTDTDGRVDFSFVTEDAIDGSIYTVTASISDTHGNVDQSAEESFTITIVAP